MRRWKNMSQMEEQDKITARTLNKMEISNMPDIKFKVTAVKISTELEKRVENLTETLNKETENMKKKSEMM